MKAINKTAVTAFAILFLAAMAAAQDLTVAVDDTRSAHPGGRDAAIQNLNRQLRSLIDTNHAKTVNVIHIGQDSWIASKEVFSIPQANQPACDEGKVKGHEKVFKPFTEHRKKVATEDCARKQTAALEELERDLDHILTAVKTAIAAAPKVAAQCTAFIDLLDRLRTSGTQGLVVVLSDARETCRSETWAAPFAPRARVILILLPSKYDGTSPAAAFAKRKARLNRLMPWLRIEPPTAENLDSL